MSMPPRRAQKRDANEPLLVKDLRRLGVHWKYGPPLDGWAGKGAAWVPTEIKDPAKPPSKRKLTDAEADFIRDCQAYGNPYCVALTAEDVLVALRAAR